MRDALPLLVYRALLRLYPDAFRERYAAEMLSDARALMAQRRRERGVRGVAAAVSLLVRDAVVNGLRQRLRRGGNRTTKPGRRGGVRMLWYDIRHGVRVLVRSPGFALAAIATIALGIGATASIFSVLHAVLLRPLPYPEPDRLVRIGELTPQGQEFATSPPNLLDFRERSATLASIGAFTGTRLTLTGAGEPQQLRATLLTPNVLVMLGARPLLGRLFTEEQERPGGDSRQIIISEGFWRSQFGADPGVVGSSVTLNGAAWTIVGVLPDSFRFLPDQQGWIPMSLDPAAARGDHRIGAIGRLSDGTTVERATEELRAIASDLGTLYPSTNRDWSVTLATFPEWIIGPAVERTLVVLQLAAALLLLIACANVAHLLLVRALAREREMGVRAALGASRRRILAQLAAESFMLCVIAGAAGVALAYAGVAVLMQLGPAALPRGDEVAVNGSVLLFTLGATGLAAVALGLVPALHLARPEQLHNALRAGPRTTSPGGRRVREALLTGQLALATLLLVGATLLLASFARLRATDIGFDTNRVLAVPVSLTSRYYAGCGTDGPGECSGDVANERLLGFMRDAVERLEALPGVVHVGATNITPLAGGSTGMEIRVDGNGALVPDEPPWADWRAVTAGFFDAAGIRIVRGRGITTTEERAGAPVVVISETLARRYWPNADPIGARLAFGTAGTNWQTVVGVARDMRDTGIQTDPREVAYIPYAGVIWPAMTLLIRAERETAGLVDDVRRTLWSIDPALPLPELRPLESYRDDALAASRFSLLLMGAFAVTALLLGILGVYGVTFFSVTRRTREFGVRLALGAGRGALLGMVLRGALRPVLLGIAIGLGSAAALSRLITSLLYGTEAISFGLYAAAGAALGIVALAASAIPAWRATRIDPRQALIAE
jgi:putative ABC transport system permease protein